jgi:hypothetical protein
MAEDWALIEAVMGGTKTMRLAGKTYLPQWPAEEKDAYEARLKTATMFPAYERTVSVLTGKPFSKPVALGKDVPARIKEWTEDVDRQGRNLHAFASEVCNGALAYGIAGILVDCPKNDGAKTVADEEQAGIRPYFVHIRHDNILGWRSELKDGRHILTQLRLMECVEEPDGQFGVANVLQVRVLEPGKWSTYRKQKNKDGIEDWVLHEDGTTSLKVVPFVAIYGKRKEFMVGTAPMLELAYTNVEHWQSKSDQQTILHVARVPMLFAKGLGPTTEIVAGTGTFIRTDGEHADVKYVEHSGKAIEAGRTSLLDLEDRMRQIGAELLVIKPGNSTTIQVMADNEQGMCDLQRMMESAEDGFDQALDLMAQWVGETEGGNVTIYKDFGAATLAEASAELLFKMKADGSLSHETLLNETKRRGILSPDVDVKKEKAQADKERQAMERKENVSV